MSQATLSIISNWGNKAEALNRAVWALAAVPNIDVTAVSRVYEADLNNYKGQPKFLCAAVRIETELSPLSLLYACHGIEAAMGRLRAKKQPVAIDIDILEFEDFESNTKELTIPHKSMLERPYILCPLLSLRPDRALKEALLKLGEKDVKLTGEGLYLPLK